MKKSKKQKLKKKAAQLQEVELSNLEKEKQEEILKTLIEEADAAIDTFNHDEAEQKLNDALKINPDHPKALELLAGVKIEKFELKEAQNILKRCIDLEPDIGFSKYFSMGQLTESEESLQYYQKGILIIEKDIENSENLEPSENKDKISLPRFLSDAYCSISEIFMTDCCNDEDADTKCLSAMESALKADSTNPDAYQCLTNFYLVQEKIEEAKEAIKKCLSLWLSQHEALRDGLADPSADNNIPSYDTRIKISKVLIELNMFEEATNVLDGLIDEDDEVVEVWYLLGWLNYIQEDEYKLNAHFYFTKAKKCSTKTGEDIYLDHINELLEELSSIVPAVEEEEEELGDEDEWDDISSESEEEDDNMET